MKTIAISIDEATLCGVDEVAAEEGTSRSRIVREALVLLLTKRAREVEEARERQVVRKHRKTLAREAAALIAEQAKP